MAIEFICSNCNTTLRVPDEHAGKQAKCPQCQSLNLIPAGVSQPSMASQSPFHSSFQSPADKAAPSNPYATPHAPGAGQRIYQPHRGALVLTLGIVSLIANCFFIPGILAWVYGRGDLKKMDAGQMDPEGRGITMAGMILGIISTALIGLLALFYVVIFFFAIMMNL